jgi:hypothetical protein
VTEQWRDTRAGQHASLLVVVKEDGGMPIIDYQPGDLPQLTMALCMQVILSAIFAREATDNPTQRALADEHVD